MIMKFNMKFLTLYLFGLCLSGTLLAQPQLPQQEIQILFPDQAAVVNGIYIDPNQGLLIKTIDGVVQTETFDLAEITGLSIPDNTAVTGFSAINAVGPFVSDASYLFSLSSSVGDFVRGDVIECDFDGCDLFDSFGENATVSALDYINRVGDLYVSFDTSFIVANNWIEPADVYRASDFAVVYDASANGLIDNNAITAFDTSEFLATFSLLRMENINNELVKPAEVYAPNLFLGNSVLDELAANVSGINAYYSADTGWVEFEEDTINISENAGFVSFNLLRVNGSENDVTFVVRDLDGTAVDGLDYNGLLNQYIFADESDGSLEITLAVIDNDVEDGTRTFTVEIVESNNDFRFSLVNPNKKLITVNILDDDGDLIFADGFE